MIQTDEIKEAFRKRFNRSPHIFSAPGRVNLIGEHVDYNNGYVLPMAIDKRTYAAVAPRDDGRIFVSSSLFSESISFKLDSELSPTGDWADYIRGVVTLLYRDHQDLTGADLYVTGDIPIGAGLSSSASVETAVGYALLSLSSIPIDPIELALTSQRAEKEFAGTNCGIMDQFTACFGKNNHALLIDCSDLTYKAIPFKTDKVKVVIANSMIKHNLASSEYNLRRADCETAITLLQPVIPHASSLRDVTLAEFNEHANVLPAVIKRRAEHVITEIARTRLAASALEKEEFERFGQLMYESHNSLRDKYEVSCKELDKLVDIASNCTGVYGSRMTGGGFGGCTVSLVQTPHVQTFINNITEKYKLATGLTAECYVCSASDGIKIEE